MAYLREALRHGVRGAVGEAIGQQIVVAGVGQALAGFVVDRFGALPVLLGGIALLGALLVSSTQQLRRHPKLRRSG